MVAAALRRAGHPKPRSPLTKLITPPKFRCLRGDAPQAERFPVGLHQPLHVMAGLVPAIVAKAWMPATSAGMTTGDSVRVENADRQTLLTVRCHRDAILAGLRSRNSH